MIDKSKALPADLQTPNSSRPEAEFSAAMPPLELVRLGLSARQRGDLLDAVRLLEAASSAAPDNLNILVELANTLRLMSRLTEAEATYHRVLERKPSQFGALVGLAHVAKLRGERTVALAHFEAAVKSDPDHLDAQVEVGNTLRELQRLDEAKTVYLRVLEQSPRGAGALIGLGHIAKIRGEWSGALAALEAAAALLPGDLRIQWEIAHTLRQLNRLDEAKSLCRRLLEQNPSHIGALTLLGSASRGRRDFEAALHHFEAAARIDPSNLDVHLEVAHTLREMDRSEEAEVAYKHVLRQRPESATALAGLGHLAKLRGDLQVALTYFESSLSAWRENPNLRSEVAGVLCDMHRLEEAERAYLRVLDDAPKHLAALLGLGRVASKRGDWSGALARFEEAAAASPDSPRPQFERMTALRELLRLDEAEAILMSLDASPVARAATEFPAKKLEHYCNTLQLEKATEYVLSWGGHRNVPSGAVALTAGLYAACGRWQDVVDLFRVRVVESASSSRLAHHPLLLEAVARAVRATGRYAEVLSLMDRLPLASHHPALQNVRDQLIEEASLVRSLGLRRDGDVPREDVMVASPVRVWRKNLLSQLFASARQTKPDRTIYLCTDEAYLLGAIVALSSLLRHNMGSLRNYRFLVFCSDELFDFASAAFAKLAAAFSVVIELRRSTSLFADGSKLRTEWGIFTPGHALSEAAYYRIYAALQLLEEGVGGRALYVDSDTCVGPFLDQLLDFNLAGRPLGARLDNSALVEIRRAAMKLDIRPEAYFNSGVLLLDLSHPALASALRKAVDISLTQKHRLTFVDQCALNLAFHGMVASLPEAFNMYVRQDTESETLTTAPVVRHFLQRPKPWDPMYQSSNCAPWFGEFAALAQVLETSMLRRLFALQFPVTATQAVMALPNSQAIASANEAFD